MRRKIELVNNKVYHICNKSIAGFKIFNVKNDFLRLVELMRFYQVDNLPYSYSRYLELNTTPEDLLNEIIQKREKIVRIIAYCIMPTHYHFILQQMRDNGISTFIGNVQNSYSRYYNIRTNRKGPLWEGKFRNVLVESDEQLLHLTRYIHLNPVTAYLADKPNDWEASSYRDYLSGNKRVDRICEFDEIIEINHDSYKEFVVDRISYQRDLAEIKDLMLD